MNYLLDTHTLLWSLISTNKLSKQVKKIISSPKENIFISTVSLWEISLKYRIGKLILKGKNPDEIPAALESLGIRILNLDKDIASTFYEFPISKNKDPFDMMIAWQAIRSEYYLITKDDDFFDYKEYGLKTVW